MFKIAIVAAALLGAATTAHAEADVSKVLDGAAVTFWYGLHCAELTEKGQTMVAGVIAIYGEDAVQRAYTRMVVKSAGPSNAFKCSLVRKNLMSLGLVTK